MQLHMNNLFPQLIDNAKHGGSVQEHVQIVGRFGQFVNPGFLSLYTEIIVPHVSEQCALTT